MAVWIDEPLWPRHGTVFAHLVSDTSVEELHAVAERAGLHPRSFDGDHYDVPAERWADAVAAGAVATTGADLARRLNASGLRLRKRKGDRGIAHLRGVRLALGDLVDIDLVASPNPATDREVGMAMCFVRDSGGDFVAVFAPKRREWGPPGGWREPGESVPEAAAREVAEECGLTIAAEELEPVGYERFSYAAPPVRGDVERPLLQLYTVAVADRRPALRVEADGIPEPRWCTRGELEQLCGHLFWWPVVDRLFPA